MFDIILTYVHVVFGSLGLISGYAILFLKKGNKLHKLIGKIYALGMTIVAISAFLTILLYRFNFFLLAVGIFSLYLVLRGYSIASKKKSLQFNLLDYFLLSWISLGTLTLIGLGIFTLMNGSMMGAVSLFFAIFSASSAVTELKMLKGKYNDKKMWWLNQHISAMLGSFIAANTAFFVQNGNRFFGNFEFQWIFWIAPTLIITPLIFKWTKQYTK